MPFVKIYLQEKPLLKRGSGRKIKRRHKVNQEALHYAVSLVFASLQLTQSVGGRPHNWMRLMTEKAGKLMIQFGQQEMDDWLNYYFFDIQDNANTINQPNQRS